jgi:hypothetical protein
VNHAVVVAVEPRELIASDRVLKCVDQALVTVCAWAVGKVLARFEDLYQVGIRDQRPRDADSVTPALADDFPDVRRRLESARYQQWNLKLRFDFARQLGVDALYDVRFVAVPEETEQRPKRTVTKEEVALEGEGATG